MTVRPVRLRELAASDLEDAADYYQEQAGASTALDFIDAVQTALEHIRTNPGIGTLRWAFELDIPGLRAWPVARFDYSVFFVETDEVIDVWRLLHMRRDIPRTLRHPDT